MKQFLTAAVILTVISLPVFAAGPALGPVINNYGPVFPLPEDGYNLAKDTQYKVSMDVSKTGDFVEDKNRSIESAARFLNMHARSGIDPNNIEFALIVHGAATKDLLSDEAYESRYEAPNPNSAMLAELSNAGVKIYLCSQSAAYKKFGYGEFNPAVTVAVSAMTAHVRLQKEGYQLIPF
ncbi:MAG: DsrE family protein [Halieaceae bacterium]